MNKLGFVVVFALVGACGDGVKPDTKVDSGGVDAQTQVARGQYIVNVLGACTFCHTPLLPNGTRDQEKLFAGIDCFADLDSPTFQDNGNGTGCLSTRNLTNHATGLANATDSQIKDAFRNGVRTDGKRIVPIMPYWVFHNMTDEDTDAVVAYLRTVPGKDHVVKANEAPFSLYNDGVIDSIPGLFNAHVTPLLDSEIPLPSGGVNNASAMRGRYLSSMVGLCIDCHSPTTSFIEIDRTQVFGGGRVFPKGELGLVDPGNTFPMFIATRNLTSHMTGLGGWTREQIRAAIADGKDREGNQVCAATHGGLVSGYAALEKQDLEDIAEYLYSLPAVDRDIGTSNCGFPPVGPPGQNPPQPETGTQCDNAIDDDGDTVPNDGCPVACTNCAGPPVP
jgi:hypothetical protein